VPCADRGANNESSEVIDILLPVTIYFNPLPRLDNAKNFCRFVISDRGDGVGDAHSRTAERTGLIF